MHQQFELLIDYLKIAYDGYLIDTNTFIACNLSLG
jgi:hypothetical protein